MIKSNEARSLTRKYYEEKRKEKLEQIAVFCDTIATNIIKEAAEAGKNEAIISNCPIDLKRDIINKLRDEGDFSVAITVNTDLKVSW